MTTHGVHLLLAEDNSSDAELILTSLAMDHRRERIHVVQDGLAALDFLFCRGVYAHRQCATPPLLVLLDVKLPKIDGLEVLRQVKRDPRTCAIPVVMLTSSNIESDVIRGYQLGANSFVQKPMDFSRFRDTVRLLGRYWLTVNEAMPDAAQIAGAANE